MGRAGAEGCRGKPQSTKGVGVVRDKELKLEDDEASHIH
jgi:hypothetical protein